MPRVEAVRPSSASSRLRILLVLCCAGACGVLWAAEIVRILVAHVGHDQAWDIYAANAVLHGVKLNGATLVEVNPPFLVWFFMLPVLLARALHVSLVDGFHCFLIASLAALIAWSGWLYRRIFSLSSLSLWLFALLVPYIAVFPIGPDDRGQREHLVAFLLLPYLLWAAARLRNQVLRRPETFLLAFLAAVAICLKPQHVLDVIAVELLLLLRLRSVRRWFRPALVFIAAGPVVYLLCVRLFAPAYLQDIVPLLTATYWGFNQPWSVVMHALTKPTLAFAVAVVLYIGLCRRLRVEQFTAILLAVSIGALLAYLQQHKGWSYQLITFQIFSYLLLVVICIDIGERLLFDRHATSLPARTWKARSFTPAVLALLVLAIASTLRLRHLQPAGYTEAGKAQLAAIYAAYPPGTAVDLLSVDPWEWPEVLEQNKVWGSRYMHLWLLPAIVRSQDPLDRDTAHHLSPAKIAELSTLLRVTTAEDLARWHPAVVAIEPCGMIRICDGLARAGYSSLLDWFNRDPSFREQWSHYHYQKTVGTMNIYTRIE